MINVTIHTDGDPMAIEPDWIEEILTPHGLDVYRVTVVHVEDVTA